MDRPDSAPPGRRRILVVDDTQTHRQVVGAILTEAGYQVIEARDGIEGVAIALRERPDAVICDVVMPEISGYQVCRFLKNDALGADTPIILVTATELSTGDRFWGLRSGADRYVPKELVAEKLVDELRALLHNRHSHAPTPARAVPGAPEELEASQIRREVGVLFDRMLFRTTIAREVRNLASFVHDEEACQRELARLVADLTGCRCLLVALGSESSARLWVTAGRKLSMDELRWLHGALTGSPGSSPATADFAALCRPPLAEVVDPDRSGVTLGPYSVAPLRVDRETVGSSVVAYESGHQPPAELDEHLTLLADEFAPVAKLLLLYQENERLSILDGLTGLHNVRYFLQRLDEAVEAHRRYHRTFSVMMLDLDHFKRVNDELGHAAGDAMLRSAAQVLSEGVRAVDLVARYGGDEFVLLMPETNLDGARLLAERLRQILRRTPLEFAGTSLRVTASIGVAEMCSECADGAEVLRRADTALYEAKGAGRNAVRAYGS